MHTQPSQAISPQGKTPLPHLGRAFTDVQEMKQASCLKPFFQVLNRIVKQKQAIIGEDGEDLHGLGLAGAHCKVAGGIDFIDKTLQAFDVPTVKGKVLIDMYGSDGWAALSCVED